ncbi:MAG: DUF2240 family protein [Nanoarchaeota archaeon]|nr:DUF2240 family protein [Nanoarchaeota archaeon]
MSSDESLEKLIETISKHSNTPIETVRKMIEDKQDELSGLVSEEGAAYIVARELGISLLKETKRQLKIKNLVTGLRSVDIVGRIVNVSETRDFERNGKPGQVANLVVGDETGVARLSMWNEEIDKIKEFGLVEGETVKLSGGYVKMDNRGNIELRIGRGKLEKIDEKIDVIDLPSKENMKEQFETIRRRPIDELKDGDYGEIKACMVQMFRRNPFFEVCPQCGSRAKLLNEKWACDEHGDVQPGHRMVVSGVADDGNGNIRVVFFSEVAEKLFGKTTDELKKIGEREMDALKIYDHINILGDEFILTGRVKQNSYTEKLEMVVNEIAKVDVKKEINNLLSELEVKE